MMLSLLRLVDLFFCPILHLQPIFTVQGHVTHAGHQESPLRQVAILDRILTRHATSFNRATGVQHCTDFARAPLSALTYASKK